MSKIISIILCLAFSSAAAASIDCTAIERITKGTQVIVHKQKLKVTFDSAKTFRMEADIAQYNFALLGEHGSKDFLIMITMGPEYTSGIIASGSFNQRGRLANSWVQGGVVHKIECFRQSAQ